ncbi:conserved hypothetical protein [Candidatus Nitrospira nitrosa]|uniref:SIR2-like domain-containing protein n=1 Tax=Candidatus Nitrospira nitrosa TaxID=1742972 RepID=A0A0S4LLA5_9BACT|nr:hypothetical protein [Candidatus Nitrospira nitrosa]CUS38277.1 conserved hypothetical protein [Candidatus Nitrospira nitrosa]
MEEAVVFLGAGASKAIGLPLANEIIPKILTRLRKNTLFAGNVTAIEQLNRCLQAVLPGLSEMMNSASDEELLHKPIPPVTDLLSSIDFLLRSTNAPIPKFGLEDLSQGRTLLERAIFELLVRNEEPTRLRMKDMPDRVRTEWDTTTKLNLLSQRLPESESEVQGIVDWVMGIARKGRVTLISTNYDIEVEQEIYKRLGYHQVFSEVDFGTGVREPVEGKIYHRPTRAHIGVYKLHGSLNWLRCDLCDTIYVNPVGPIAYLSFLSADDGKQDPAQTLFLKALEENGATQCHCGNSPLRAVIVSPSFVRDVRDPILLEIWRNALDVLRRASQWFIVGYSFPPEDVAIRSMFLRAYSGRDEGLQDLEIVVVQKEEKEPEKTRYALLLPKHTYRAEGLSNFLKSDWVRGNEQDKPDKNEFSPNPRNDETLKSKR